jgi:hypothetical protein
VKSGRPALKCLEGQVVTTAQMTIHQDAELMMI